MVDAQALVFIWFLCSACFLSYLIYRDYFSKKSIQLKEGRFMTQKESCLKKAGDGYLARLCPNGKLLFNMDDLQINAEVIFLEKYDDSLCVEYCLRASDCVFTESVDSDLIVSGDMYKNFSIKNFGKHEVCFYLTFCGEQVGSDALH